MTRATALRACMRPCVAHGMLMHGNGRMHTHLARLNNTTAAHPQGAAARAHPSWWLPRVDCCHEMGLPACQQAGRGTIRHRRLPFSVQH